MRQRVSRRSVNDDFDRLRRLSEPRVRNVWLATWFAFGCLVALAIHLVSLSEQRLYADLAERGVKVAGHVRVDPDNHGDIYFTFNLGGRSYRDDSFPNKGNYPDGKPIDIVYDPRNPHRMCWCDPQEERKYGKWWQLLIGGILVTGLVAPWAGISLEPRVSRLLGLDPLPPPAPPAPRPPGPWPPLPPRA